MRVSRWEDVRVSGHRRHERAETAGPPAERCVGPSTRRTGPQRERYFFVCAYFSAACHPTRPDHRTDCNRPVPADDWRPPPTTATLAAVVSRRRLGRAAPPAPPGVVQFFPTWISTNKLAQSSHLPSCFRSQFQNFIRWNNPGSLKPGSFLFNEYENGSDWRLSQITWLAM